jgi:putative addiction module killer protein
MIEIRGTETFSAWLRKLRDSRAKAKIASRTRRLAFGNPGDVRPAGEGVSELRIDYGPGYRVYSEKENPRLCRGGSSSLTFPGVCPGFLFLKVGH